MTTAFRGQILHFKRAPADASGRGAAEFFPDGLLVVRQGRIQRVGAAKTLLRRLPVGTRVMDHSGRFIVPGFVDCHVHFPQIESIACPGGQLLEWLNRHVFPAEIRFRDAAHAARVAPIFLKELLRNGTTTAMVFSTTHPQSADALFAAALSMRMRLIVGKVMMDRHAPAALLDSAESAGRQTRRLIEKWHGRDRLLYAVTPRFAPTSSGRQLATAGAILEEYPGLRLQTHLAENLKEVAWVKKLFPKNRGYLDVYARHGLLGPRSLFAHAIHLSGRERDRLAETGSAVAFCPTSNLFLGSGLFDLEAARVRKIRVGIGSDIGAGTSFSILQNLQEAYKIAQLQGQSLSPWEAFYLATLGGAQALGLQDIIGNFEPGKEADFIILDPKAIPLLEYRFRQVKTLGEKLFLFMVLGDDRLIREAYLLGRRAHRAT